MPNRFTRTIVRFSSGVLNVIDDDLRMLWEAWYSPVLSEDIKWFIQLDG